MKDKQALLKLCYFHFIFALPPIVVAVAGGWSQSCHRGCVDVAWIMPSKISCWTFQLSCIKCSMSLGPHLKLSWTKNWRRKNGIDFHETNICYFRICDASLCLQNRFFSLYVLMIWSCMQESDPCYWRHFPSHEFSVAHLRQCLTWILFYQSSREWKERHWRFKLWSSFSTIGLGTYNTFDSDWKLRQWRWNFLHCSITLVDFHYHSPTSVSSADKQR